MKTLNIQRIVLFLCVALIGISNLTYAQVEDDKKAEREAKKEARRQAKANNNKANAALANSISTLSREEKNTMKVCPLHNKRMKLSDNYRANASDFRQSEDYPFAYQLNYRRYCKVCTKALEQEVKSFEKEEKRNAGEGSFARCEVHNQVMKINGDYSSLNYERDPDPATPHAKQYLFKEYCKICTKIVKKNGDDEVEE